MKLGLHGYWNFSTETDLIWITDLDDYHFIKILFTIYSDFTDGLNRSWTYPNGLDLNKDMDMEQSIFQTGRSQWGKQTCLLSVPALWFRPYPENHTEVGKLSGFQEQTRPI